MTDTSTVEIILEKLAVFAVPIDERDFSNEEYNWVFPCYAGRGSEDGVEPILKAGRKRRRESPWAYRGNASNIGRPGSHYSGTGR